MHYLPATPGVTDLWSLVVKQLKPAGGGTKASLLHKEGYYMVATRGHCHWISTIACQVLLVEDIRNRALLEGKPEANMLKVGESRQTIK